MPSSWVAVVVETLVSLMILHSAPTMTAPLRSVTLAEIRASCLCVGQQCRQKEDQDEHGALITTPSVWDTAQLVGLLAAAQRRIPLWVVGIQAGKTMTPVVRGEGTPSGSRYG